MDRSTSKIFLISIDSLKHKVNYSFTFFSLLSLIALRASINNGADKKQAIKFSFFSSLIISSLDKISINI